MKAEEPTVEAKYSQYKDEILKLGHVDFETDLSSAFGKLVILTFQDSRIREIKQQNF